MTQKADQLLLELCLLRVRYSSAEIEKVGKLHFVRSDPELRALTLALRELREMGDASPKREIGAKRKNKKLSSSLRINPTELSSLISRFIDRIESKEILRTDRQLENFAQSIGVTVRAANRQESAKTIQKKLEELSLGQVTEKIMSVDRIIATGSGAYVDLAKTLMKS